VVEGMGVTRSATYSTEVSRRNGCDSECYLFHGGEPCQGDDQAQGVHQPRHERSS